MLKAHDIVKVWEVADGKPSWEQAVLLLAPAFPDEPLENLAYLSLGGRNARLFRLREALFGPSLEANSTCPECAEGVEFKLDSQVICNPEVKTPEESEFHLEADEYEIIHRAVNSYDLKAVAIVREMEGPESAEFEIMTRCILSVKKAGVSQPATSLPDDILAKVAESIKDNDPHSEIICRLSCPECSHSWPEPFNIASFFWHEVEMKAHIILTEVQLLAKAFGWWEGDILSLTDVRRRYYLDSLNE